MKKILPVLIVILLWVPPIFTFRPEPLETGYSSLQMVIPFEEEFNADELSEITGQGSKICLPEGVEAQTGKIKLWDETQANHVGGNFSTGSGNFQSNTLSVQGR
jgi:hypothetical protein